jgi:hypothetical protein
MEAVSLLPARGPAEPFFSSECLFSLHLPSDFNRIGDSMKKVFASLLLVAFLAVSASAYAQETKKDASKASTQTSTQTANKSNKPKKAKKAKKGVAGTSNSTSTPPK